MSKIPTLFNIDHDDGTLVTWLAPGADSHEHHHIHDPSHIICYGDYAEGWKDVEKLYRGRDDRTMVVLPHCIYPCWTVRANRIAHNIAELSMYP